MKTKKKISKSKKIIKKKTVKVDVIADAIKLYKKDNSDWAEQDQSDLYGIESYIDGLLYEKKYAKYGYSKKYCQENELILERLTFKAIKKMQGGKRHTCDIYYDDAFNGHDGY